MLKTQVIGNLGKDAEVKQINDNWKVLTFSVAHTKKVKGQDTTVWVTVQQWYKQADNIGVLNYLKKGTQVWCEGEPKIESWTNKNTGELSSKLVLDIFDRNGILLLSSPKLSGSETVPPTNYGSGGVAFVPEYDPKAPAVAPPADGEDDDLPF